MAGLLDAVDLPGVARVVVPRLQSVLAGSQVSLAWWVLGLDNLQYWPGPSGGPLPPRLLDRATATNAGDGLVRLHPGCYALRISSNKSASGAFLVIQTAHPPSPEHRQLCLDWEQAVRPYVDNALDKAHLRQSMSRSEQAERTQRALFAISDIASSDLDMAEMLRGLHGIVGGLMYASNFYITTYDCAADAIEFIYFADTAHEEWQEPYAHETLSSIERSLTWYLIRDARPMRGDAQQLRAQTSGPLEIIGPAAADWLGVPIITDGQVHGVMVVQSYDEAGCYGPEDEVLLSYVGSHIITALDRRRAREQLQQRTSELDEQILVRRQVEKQLKHQVLHDSLTGLPNRAYLCDHLARAISHRRRDPAYQFAVLFMDLDRFKAINDSAGHSIGDNLLKEVANRFSSNVRAPDIVARLGGDEFAVFMDDIEGSDAAVRLARRLVDALSEPFNISGRELHTGVSIGIVLGDDRSQDAEDLLRDADIAMYRAKANNSERFELFDEQLQSHAKALLELENELRDALARKEFVHHFQPVVTLEAGKTVGYEALLRWNHPTRGLLSPEDFLKVAEDSGVLESIDWQVLDDTFAMIPSLIGPGQHVTVNLAESHFRSELFSEKFLALLAGHGLPRAVLRIDMPASALSRGADFVRQTLGELQEAGIKVNLDGFDDQHANLGALLYFPLHGIKLERCLVARMERRGQTGPNPAEEVARAAAAVARSLGLEVVAEGVETDSGRQHLLDLGCQFAQGHLFGHPRPADTLTTKQHGVGAVRA